RRCLLAECAVAPYAETVGDAPRLAQLHPISPRVSADKYPFVAGTRLPPSTRGSRPLRAAFCADGHSPDQGLAKVSARRAAEGARRPWHGGRMLGGGSHPSSTCRATAAALGPD